MQRLVEILRAASITMVTDPHTGPLHARVKQLLAADIRVCLGQDDISDAYYPFGRNNMLEVAFLAAHMLWMMTRNEVNKLYDMITVDAAAAINIARYGLTPGCRANIVVLNHDDIVHALRFHDSLVHVISNGQSLTLRASVPWRLRKCGTGLLLAEACVDSEVIRKETKASFRSRVSSPSVNHP